MERGERLRIEALSSGELKQKMELPLLVRETIQGLDQGQSSAFGSTHSRDGRLPANLPMAAYEKDSLLELSMDKRIVRDGLPLVHVEGGKDAGLWGNRGVGGTKKRLAKVLGV